jgi:hypothetical protein
MPVSQLAFLIKRDYRALYIKSLQSLQKLCARCRFERSRECVLAYNAFKAPHFLDSARNDTSRTPHN